MAFATTSFKFKPERPLIVDIPYRSGSAVNELDPLRTPEDVPAVRHHHHPPYWDVSQIDDGLYHFPSYDEQHRFPDVADAGWDLSLVSPPSPARRTMEIPDDDVDTFDDLPTLSPPSPSRRSLALLPDPAWQPSPIMDDCPQLSPPSPVHCNSSLPSIDPDFDACALFVEDSDDTPALTSPPPLFHAYTAEPSLLAERLHEEYHALMSLRDRTIHAERTSRARNAALRGRERELGRAVAALRDAHADTASGSDTDTLTTLRDGPSATSDPTPTEALHAYRALATTVMLERTEEKRRRKKDKERLKELRVILGVGVHALLYLAGDTEAYGGKFADHSPLPVGGDLGLAPRGTTDLGIGPPALTLLTPALMPRISESQHQHCPVASLHEEDDTLYIAPQKTPGSDTGLGLGLGLDLSVGGPLTPSPFAALADRTVAMRKLVARMTMRRRYLGMRSLIEAGNMSGAGGELLGGSGESPGGAVVSQKRERTGSMLARVVVGAEELQALDALD